MLMYMSRFVIGKWWDCVATRHAEMPSLCWKKDQLWAWGSCSDEIIW